MLARMHSMQQTIAKQRQQAMRKFQEPLPRGLLVLPYLSIVSEKTDHMSRLLADVKWRVQGYQGDTEGQPLANKVSGRPVQATRQPQSGFDRSCTCWVYGIVNNCAGLLNNCRAIAG